jgi:hypothetical protein
VEEFDVLIFDDAANVRPQNAEKLSENPPCRLVGRVSCNKTIESLHRKGSGPAYPGGINNGRLHPHGVQAPKKK